MSDNFDVFAKLDKSKLANQYVVIVNKELFATGGDIESMLKEARKQYPGKIPFVTKVPGEELLVL